MIRRLGQCCSYVKADSALSAPSGSLALESPAIEMNLLDDNAWMPQTWPPERPGFEWRRKRVAGEHLGASLYALPPGQATFPYHYELGNDELLVVVSGTPTLRTSEGERELGPGDCIHFPSGEAGAHQVVNRSGARRASSSSRTSRCRVVPCRSIARR